MNKTISIIITISIILFSLLLFGNTLLGIVFGESSSIGFEMTVSVKAHVDTSINASIIYRNSREDFGACGSVNYGKGPADGGATVAGGSNLIGDKVEVRWGIDCEDFMEQDHSVFFDTSKFVALKKQTKSVVFEYHGNGKWVIKLYDAMVKSTRKLLGEDTVVESWRKRQWIHPSKIEASFISPNMENLYIETLSGNYSDSWNKYSTKRITFIDIGRVFFLQWGIKGADGIAMRHKVAYDTMKYYNIKDQVQSVEFEIDGDYCTMRLYDKLQGEDSRRELGSEKQKYVWLEGVIKDFGGIPISVPEGYELSVTCDPAIDSDVNVPKEIAVSVIADGYEEGFGLIESQIEKDSGKRIYCSRIRAYWPFEIGKDFEISWQDKAGTKYFISVPTKELVEIKDKIKSVELEYKGDKKWNVKYFDEPILKDNRKLLREVLVSD